MGAPFHCYTCADGGQILENWGKVKPKCAVVSWLRLLATTDCLPHPFWKYTKCLSTFKCCGWAYGCTITLLSVQVWAKFWEIKVRQGPNDVVVWLRL